MESALQSTLETFGVSAKGIAKMEVDGVTDEASLKAKVNEYGDTKAVQKAWTISKAAAEKLVEKYLDAPPPSEFSSEFESTFAPLAAATDLTTAQIFAAFDGYGDSDTILEMVKEGVLEEEEIVSLFTRSGEKGFNAKVTLGVKKVLKAFETPTNVIPGPTPVAGSAPTPRAAVDMSLLPSLPEDGDSLLSALATGGVAKFSSADAVVAIRGALTRALGVDRILPVLTKRVLEHAEAMDLPAPELYYTLKRAQTRRSYADVLAAFDGSITSVPEADKARFVEKVATLWPRLAEFQGKLDAYRQLHKDESGDVANIVLAIRSGSSGIEYPDPMPVVSAARALIDEFNRVFAGLGIPAARTIGKDLVMDAELLRDAALPGLVGAGSFEEMIKKLELDVPVDAQDQERSIAGFVLGVLELPKQPADICPEYILALQRRGKPITWPGTSAYRTAGRPSSFDAIEGRTAAHRPGGRDSRGSLS